MILASVWLRNVTCENLFQTLFQTEIFFSFHYFKSSAGSFFLVFSNRLSATFDIQIDLKMKHS